MRDLGSLSVKLDADLRGLKSGLSQATSGIDRFSKASTKSFQSLSSAATSLKTALVGAFTGAAITAVKSSLSALEQIGDTAERLGVSTKFFQEYGYAAQQAGVSSEQFGTSLSKLSQNVAEAQQGNKQLQEAFAEVGVTLDELGSLSSEEIFKQVIEGIGNLTSEAQQLETTRQIMGKTADSFVNLAKMGGAGIDELVSKANKLGLVVPEELIQNASEASDAIDTVGETISKTFGGALAANKDQIIAFGQAIIDVVRALAPFLEYMDEAVKIGAGFAVYSTIKTVFQGLSGALAGVASAFVTTTGAAAANTKAVEANVSATVKARAVTLMGIATQQAELQGKLQQQQAALASARATGVDTAATEANIAATQQQIASIRARVAAWKGAETATISAAIAQNAKTAADTAGAAAAGALARATAFLSTTMQRLGGPMGILFGVITAVSLLSGWFGKAKKSASELQGEIDGLIGSLETLTEAQLEANRVKFATNIAEQANEVAKANAAIQSTSRELASAQNRGDTGRVKELTERLQSLRQQAADAEAALMKTEEGQMKLDNILAKKREQATTRQTGGVSWTDEQATSLQTLSDKLDPASAKTREFTENIALLDNALKAGKISWEEYERLIALATTDSEALAKETEKLRKEQEKNEKETEKAAEKAEKLADEIQRTKEQFIDLIDPTASVKREMAEATKNFEQGGLSAEELAKVLEYLKEKMMDISDPDFKTDAEWKQYIEDVKGSVYPMNDLIKKQYELNEAMRLGKIDKPLFDLKNVQLGKEMTTVVNQLNEETNSFYAAMKEAGNEAFDAFTDAIINGEKLSEVFRGLEKDMLRIAMRALVSKPFETFLGGLGGMTQWGTRPGSQQTAMLAAQQSGFGGGLGGILGGLFSSIFSAKGNVFQSGNVVPFANGGVIGGPVGFRLSNGQLGLAGEAGAEAIMPLARTAGGELGVKAKGQGMTVINNINITTPTGKVSPYSIEQVQASVAQGLSRANMRNT